MTDSMSRNGLPTRLNDQTLKDKRSNRQLFYATDHMTKCIITISHQKTEDLKIV